MSIFKSLFAKQEDEFSDFEWIPFLEEIQLEEILEQSKTKTIHVFKHSTRCGISSSVLRRYEKNRADKENELYYYLDILRFRPISNFLASKFDITHQSPQLIVFKDKKVIHHTSHHSILDY